MEHYRRLAKVVLLEAEQGGGPFPLQEAIAVGIKSACESVREECARMADGASESVNSSLVSWHMGQLADRIRDQSC